jgi:hypothetical protein
MAQPSRVRRIAVWAVLCLATLLVVAAALIVFVVPRFFPWTRLACSTESIDINSGRVRREAWLLGVRRSDLVEETEISAKYRRLVGEPPAPEWRPVMTLSPWMPYSPHYAYHGAVYDMLRLNEAFQYQAFSESAQRQAIVTFFDLLKTKRSDFVAACYVDAIRDRLVERKQAGQTEPFSKDELPDPTSVGDLGLGVR